MGMQPAGGKAMKNRAIMKKFRMRIGVVLFMVLIMLMGSCLSELRFSALAMDTASEALAETSREEAPLPSSSMLQPEPVVTPEPKENIPAATQPPVPEGGQEETPAAVSYTHLDVYKRQLWMITTSTRQSRSSGSAGANSPKSVRWRCAPVL